MPSSINMLMVAELAERFHRMSHAILVDFTGMSAQQADGLRRRLRGLGAHLLVVKNSLAVLALRQLELLDVAELVDGPIAFVYGAEDPVALAKALLEWGRREGVLKARGGMLDGRAIDAKGVEQLAALPPLQVLHAQVAGAIAAPLSGFIGALQAVPRAFAGALKAIADQKEQEGQAGGSR